MIRIIPIAIVLITLAMPASGQSDSLRSIYKEYDTPEKITGTRAPRGYKPVYISHYGRHGSRYHLQAEVVAPARDSLLAASLRGTLTPLGESMLERMKDLCRRSEGYWGELSQIGVTEQEGIARRMVRRCRAAFRGGRRVDAFSGTKARCVSSRDAATGELLLLRPHLKLSCFSGEDTDRYLVDETILAEPRKWYNPRLDSVMTTSVDWHGCVARLYTDCRADAAASMRLARGLWLCWADAPCVGMDDYDILQWLTPEEHRIMAGWTDMNICLKCLKTDRFGDLVVEGQRLLLQDIITRADKALSEGNTAATLRFGHDSNLAPLMVLMGVVGFGDTYSLGSEPDPRWKNARMMPMAANLQIIFYAHRSKDATLVKLLYNEKEVFISGLKPVKGPYYNWEDLKHYWTKLKESVTWKKLRANPAPLPIIGEIAPKRSNLDSPSFWSVGVETMDRDYADFSQFSRFVGETGVGYGRLQSGWAKTEQKKGRYDFTWLDEHVDGLISEGVHPWMCLCYGNPIYSRHGHDLNAKLFSDGPVMDGWLRYVKACVARYKGRVTMWEVWNEPDGRNNLDSYALYANLFVRTAKAIREVDPEAKIAAFGSCSPDREYIRQALELIDKAGGIPFIDYITFHAYWPLPETIVPAIKQLRADVDAYNPDIVLLQGETGCPGQLEYGHAMRNIEWNEYSQAKWDLRQAMTHFSLGIPYSFFTMVDLNYGWMLQSFGLIRMNGRKEPVYKRPKFYAVQHVTSFLTTSWKATDEVKVDCSNKAEVFSFGLEKDGEPAGCVLWLDSHRPSGTLERTPCAVRISGLRLKDPVYIDLLTGYVHSLNGKLDNVPLWDCPVVITEKKYWNNN